MKILVFSTLKKNISFFFPVFFSFSKKYFISELRFFLEYNFDVKFRARSIGEVFRVIPALLPTKRRLWKKHPQKNPKHPKTPQNTTKHPQNTSKSPKMCLQHAFRSFQRAKLARIHAYSTANDLGTRVSELGEWIQGVSEIR